MCWALTTWMHPRWAAGSRVGGGCSGKRANPCRGLRDAHRARWGPCPLQAPAEPAHNTHTVKNSVFHAFIRRKLRNSWPARLPPPPQAESLQDALRQLYVLDAIDVNGQITGEARPPCAAAPAAVRAPLCPGERLAHRCSCSRHLPPTSSPPLAPSAQPAPKGNVHRFVPLLHPGRPAPALRRRAPTPPLAVRAQTRARPWRSCRWTPPSQGRSLLPRSWAASSRWAAGGALPWPATLWQGHQPRCPCRHAAWALRAAISTLICTVGWQQGPTLLGCMACTIALMATPHAELVLFFLMCMIHIAIPSCSSPCFFPDDDRGSHAVSRVERIHRRQRPRAAGRGGGPAAGWVAPLAHAMAMRWLAVCALAAVFMGGGPPCMPTVLAVPALLPARMPRFTPVQASSGGGSRAAAGPPSAPTGASCSRS